jgi:transposase
MESSQPNPLGAALTAVHSRCLGAIPLLFPILEALQVRTITNRTVPSQADIDLGQLLVLLVLNRLLAPRPLYRIREWVATTHLPQLLALDVAQLYDMRLGRALDQLYPHLGELWMQIASRAVQTFDLDLTILHWDLTSIYFEGAYTDSQLARYGYSRDHRPDSKQITLQVDVTHEETVPILYASLPGNTADITRPLPHLVALLRFLARPELSERRLHPILVSDCKMITAEAVLACHRNQLFYLGPLPPSAETEALLRSVSVEELADHPLSYRPSRAASDPDFVPYAGVWRPYRLLEDGQLITDRALVVWSSGKARLDEHKRKTYLKRLLNQLEAIAKKLNTRRYKLRSYVEGRLSSVQQGNPAKGLVDISLTGSAGRLALHFQINRSQLAQAQALDGRYALATNALHLSASATLQVFKGQDGIEKRFRSVKGPLQLHPLYVRSDARIEGLVLITMLAVLVRALLERQSQQQQLELNADQLLALFAPLQVLELQWVDGSVEHRTVGVSLEQTHILQRLGWPEAAGYAQALPRPLG